MEQVQAAATVHKDSSEVKSVNDGVEDQCGRTAMTNTGGVVPAIEGDRTRRPCVELWGDLLHRIDVPQCTLPFSLGNMCGVDHVNVLDSGGKQLLATVVRHARFVVIVVVASRASFVGLLG